MSAQQPSTDSQAPEPAKPEKAEPSFGWTQYAEQTNGRFAMVGFIALITLELITGQTFLTWIGLR